MADTTKQQLTLRELRTYEPHLTLTHVGDYEACVMVFSMPSAGVAALLPAGLELAPQSITPSGQHPVILFVGDQVHVRSQSLPDFFCPLLTWLCMTFLEAAIAIPFVQKVGASAASPKLFCSVTLYLNEDLPIFLGWLAGFPKRRGRLARLGDAYDVQTMAGDPLLRVDFTPTGPFDGLPAFPHLGPLRPMFEQTHIGQLFSLATPLLDAFICSSIDLRLSAAQYQPVTIKGTLTPAFSTLLPSAFKFNGIDADPMGAFRLRTTWELPPPNPC